MLPMAIDFGSVNTTAGVYLDSAYFENVGEQAAVKNCRENEINYTAFEDGAGESILLPSVIGVLAVEEEDEKLLFGYAAIRLANARYVDEGYCVFYDVKRCIREYRDVGGWERWRRFYVDFSCISYEKRRTVLNAAFRRYISQVR